MRLRPREHGERERGTVAVMVAFLMFVVCGVGALAVDLTTQVKEHQRMYDTIDSAAHAGAFRLPTLAATAVSEARANALANDPALTGALLPTVDLYCVVAVLSGSVDNSQIPQTCNPISKRGGTAPNYTWTGASCNTKICSIPCSQTVGTSDVCNTVKVTGSKPVPFAFAPAIGVSAPGGTGSVSSAACKGPCGTLPPNPMDIAVVADRTGSMTQTNVNGMISGIKAMYQNMNPSQQYVALGTIHRSKLNAANTTCTGSPPGSVNKGLTEPSTSSTAGPWMPVPFHDNYLDPGTTNINANSTLIHGTECLYNRTGSVGTYLASPLKSAARLLLGLSVAPETVNNITSSLPARTGTVRKGIIFETDGAPNENSYSGTTSLSNAVDIGDSDGRNACQDFENVATNAKAAPNNILIVTVAFNVSTTQCSTDSSGSGSGGDSDFVRDVLARVASPAPNANGVSVPSDADSDCSDSTERNTENADGDYFFCAATGAEMAFIYQKAFTQLNRQVRLIQLP